MEKQLCNLEFIANNDSKWASDAFVFYIKYGIGKLYYTFLAKKAQNSWNNLLDFYKKNKFDDNNLIKKIKDNINIWNRIIDEFGLFYKPDYINFNLNELIKFPFSKIIMFKKDDFKIFEHIKDGCFIRINKTSDSNEIIKCNGNSGYFYANVIMLINKETPFNLEKYIENVETLKKHLSPLEEIKEIYENSFDLILHNFQNTEFPSSYIKYLLDKCNLDYYYKPILYVDDCLV
uniref:Uncharacterized protein n=1 Tax=viral metagenome TaxID=1070528 RepID=A0A6C0H526_9ZZZZ